MSIDWGLGMVAGLILGSAIVMGMVGSESREREADCQRQHNVYECAAIYVPVTPDGQPLDMSDPFHGEDE